MRSVTTQRRVDVGEPIGLGRLCVERRCTPARLSCCLWRGLLPAAYLVRDEDGRAHWRAAVLGPGRMAAVLTMLRGHLKAEEGGGVRRSCI